MKVPSLRSQPEKLMEILFIFVNPPWWPRSINEHHLAEYFYSHYFLTTGHFAEGLTSWRTLGKQKRNDIMIHCVFSVCCKCHILVILVRLTAAILLSCGSHFQGPANLNLNLHLDGPVMAPSWALSSSTYKLLTSNTLCSVPHMTLTPVMIVRYF